MASDQLALFAASTGHDPGGKVRIAIPASMEGWADISPCGRYRTLLGRRWGDGPAVLWVGMNPSTADALHNDPTVLREIAFTIAWGFSAYLKCNVMDYRATDPKALRVPFLKPCSDANLRTIADFARVSPFVMCVWGKIETKALRHHADAAERALRATGKPLFCLGRNADGSPKHPLYLRGDTPREPF